MNVIKRDHKLNVIKRSVALILKKLLLNVPMSLTDLNFFSPFGFIEIAARRGYRLEWTTFAHDRVHSDRLFVDMQKRLTNALRDAKLDNSNLDRLLEWLRCVITIDKEPQLQWWQRLLRVHTRPVSIPSFSHHNLLGRSMIGVFYNA